METSVSTSVQIRLNSSLAQTSSVIGTQVSSNASTTTPVIQTSSPQTSITTSFTSMVSVTVQPAISDHKTTTSVGPLPQKSSTTSFTSRVSVTVTTSIPDHETTTTVVPFPQTSVTSSVSINATSAPQQDVYIKMTFKMPWGRLCFLLTLFKEALSDDLIEMKDLKYERVDPARIKLRNVNAKCENKTYYNDKAVLKFHISNSTEDLGTVDREMTIKAFEILYYYWVNQRMILLDKVFEKKVSSRREKKLINE